MSASEIALSNPHDLYVTTVVLLRVLLTSLALLLGVALLLRRNQ